MNQKLVKMAEALGIETKGKTELQIMAEIDTSFGQEKTTIEQNVKQQSIENGVNLLPNIKKQFEKPIEIWIEKLQNGTKPECLPVVGYNPQSSSFIVSKSAMSETGEIKYKVYQVSEELVIKSAKKLDQITAELKAKRKEAAEKAKATKAAKESGKKKTNK
jgi:hypothetical protein